jgi:hypothetical protein
MSQELEQAAGPELESIDHVAAQVMETMFFTEAMVTDCDHGWLGRAFTARIKFDGTHCGQVFLTISTEAAQSIAAGFLGLEMAEMAEAQLNQVILELANIFCGAAMSRLWPESSLTLDAPELVAAELPVEGVWHRCFTMPEGTLAVSICLFGQLAPTEGT